MERNTVSQTLQLLIHRYKYAVLLLLAGLGLMLMPPKPEPQPPPQVQPLPGLEEKLEDILSSVAGAGKVRVLLTEQIGSETYYQTDRRQDSDGERNSDQADTVLIETPDRSESGLVRRRDPPRYLGALIVCQGADSPQVRLSVVQAVECVTGLRSDQIQVVKMK